jgi:(1->4)-alpha-D-glucan 1-alpha-D-glucosylmutase
MTSELPPTATYRLQLQPAFPFSAATAAVPYLASLGVSHLHLSPVLEAVPGSGHGYDVTDHTRVRHELGGEQGLRTLARTARAHGLGLILDIVPNHMAVPAPENLNRPLWEVLKHGPESPYARWFDIDWEAGGGKVLLPVLGRRIGEELDAGALRVDGEVLRYADHAVPLKEGTAGLPLPELLDAQWWRLGWWRLARTELNYRRFFSISELIGVRVQDPEVFAATHDKVLQLLRDGVIDGLRIDHPDGLADPEGYLRVLKEATGGCWTVVEKILTTGERLPPAWPVAGTTGYDALRHIDGLFVDPSGADELATLYREFAQPAGDRGGYWEATTRRAAYQVVTHELAAEVGFLERTANRICAAEPALRDHAPWALRTAIRELLVRVPVYRSYVKPGRPSPDADAVLTPEAALAAKAAFTVPKEAAAVDVVRELALGRLGDGPEHAAFCARFAQTSSALRAKSVEDTAFYRYTPLLSACEVGGDPARPAVGAEEFHTYCARIQRDWPTTGTVLSTHDTKRSGDVRARIAVLTECPDRWAALLAKVTEESARGDRVPAPDPHLAWVAWQTAFGCGHPVPERLVPALLKSVREAGLRTSWTESEPAYEKAVEAFVRDGPCGSSLHTVAQSARELDPYVRANVLGAALLHLTMPGVPDVYQGSERDYLALVDPDNRHPFQAHTPALRRLEEGGTPTDLSAEKLRLTAAALRLRSRDPAAFGESATYEPLAVRGPAAAHCVAFCRSGRMVTAVTRLSLRLAEAGGWRDTELELPGGRWADTPGGGGREIEGGPVPLSSLLAESPVALFVRL